MGHNLMPAILKMQFCTAELHMHTRNVQDVDPPDLDGYIFFAAASKHEEH